MRNSTKSNKKKLSPAVEMDDLMIIKAIKDGNKQSFATIVKRYEPFLAIRVSKVIKDEEAAKDVLQDIFIKVFANISKYKKQHTFNSWLTKVAQNHLIDVIRKRKSSMEHNFISLDTPISSGVDGNITRIDIADEMAPAFDEESYEQVHVDNYNKVSDVIDTLPEIDKAIIRMFYIEKKRQAEIASKLNISNINLRVKLNRIMKKLSELLSDNKLKLENSF